MTHTQKQTNKKTLNIGKGTPGPGRPKGASNKTTRTAKEAIALAAERLGGVDRLVNWCKEDPANEKAFWSSVYPKLLPLQVSNEGEDAFRVDMITRRVVDTNE